MIMSCCSSDNFENSSAASKVFRIVAACSFFLQLLSIAHPPFLTDAVCGMVIVAKIKSFHCEKEDYNFRRTTTRDML